MRDGGIGRWGLVAAALPFIVSVVAILAGVGVDYRPQADLATTELVTRDVGRHEVLLGPFSRDGWHHPGPLFFYLLAVPYRLLGAPSSALPAAAALINGASVVGMVAIARRRGGTPLMLVTLLACGLLVRALGFETLAMPWNPFVTVLPYGLLVMLTWAMTCGERWALPVATLVTTFLVQTHVGFAAIALPLLALGAVWLLVDGLRRPGAAPAADGPVADTLTSDGFAADALAADALAAAAAAAAGGGPAGGAGDRPPAGGSPAGGSPAGREPVVGDSVIGDSAGDALPEDGRGRDGQRRSGKDDRRARLRAAFRGRRRLVGAVGLATLVGLVGWFPPLMEEATNDPGNLRRIIDWFQSHGEESATPMIGWRAVSAQFGWVPEWLGGAGPVSFMATPLYLHDPLLPVLLVPLVAAVVVGWHRLGADGRRLLSVWFVASVIGVVAVSRTVGPVYAYRLGWTWVLAAVAGVYTLWVAWDRLAARWPDLERRVLIPVAVGVLAVVTAVDVVAAARAGAPKDDDSRVVAGLTAQVLDALPPGDEPVTVQPGEYGTIGSSSGLLLALERAGVDAHFGLPTSAEGEHRAPPEGPVRDRLVVVGGTNIRRTLDSGGHEVVAYVGEVAIGDIPREMPAGEHDRRVAEATAVVRPPGAAPVGIGS